MKSRAFVLATPTVKCCKSEVKAVTIIAEQRTLLEVLEQTHQFDGKLVPIVPIFIIIL